MMEKENVKFTIETTCEEDLGQYLENCESAILESLFDKRVAEKDEQGNTIWVDKKIQYRLLLSNLTFEDKKFKFDAQCNPLGNDDFTLKETLEDTNLFKLELIFYSEYDEENDCEEIDYCFSEFIDERNRKDPFKRRAIFLNTEIDYGEEKYYTQTYVIPTIEE